MFSIYYCNLKREIYKVAVIYSKGVIVLTLRKCVNYGGPRTTRAKKIEKFSTTTKNFTSCLLRPRTACTNQSVKAFSQSPSRKNVNIKNTSGALSNLHVPHI